MSNTHVVSYTTRAQRVFFNAQREAAQRGQKYIGPEQLLLALLNEPDNMACQTLKRLRLSLDDLRARTVARMPAAKADDANDAAPTLDMAEVRLTPRAHRVLALAFDEARKLRHNSIGTEHLLLGLVREREGLPGRLLARAGVDLDRAQQTVISLTGGQPADLTAYPASRASEPKTLQSLLAALKHDGRTGKPVLGLEWLVAYFFASLMLFIILVRASPWEDDWSSLLYIVFCFGVLRSVYRIINRMVASPRQREAAQRLAQLQDKRVVGHLVEFTTWPDEAVRRASKRALTRMLPHLQPGDAALFSPSQQGVLRGLLHRRNVELEPDLQIATLRAYEQIGDDRALPVVSALATMRPRTENRRRVRAAAEECLPYLQQRRQRHQSSQTLLRPTQQHGAEATKEILLRPAMHQGDTKQDELLRPDAINRVTGG